MTCEGYPTEVYGLFVLGLLEEAEAAEVRGHVESQCTTCLRELRAAASLWYLVGTTEAQGTSAKPSPDLRRRILEGVSGPGPIPIRQKSPMLLRLGAMAAGLFVCAATFYWGRTSRSVPADQGNRDSAAISQSQEQAREWRSRAEAAEKKLEALSSPQTAEKPVPPLPVNPADPRVRDELAEALAANRRLEDALARERSRAGALESELASQRVVLAAAQQQANDAQKQAAAAVEDRSRLSERDDRVTALAARVQELERENATYRETVVRLEREFDRSARLVAFLSSPSLRMVKLESTEAGHQATAHAFILDNQKVLFYAANLPPLPAGRTYQLWIVSGKGPGIVSGGVSRPDGAHRLSLEFDHATTVREIRGLAVTDEPAGGSPGPTGHKILVGTVHS